MGIGKEQRNAKKGGKRPSPLDRIRRPAEDTDTGECIWGGVRDGAILDAIAAATLGNAMITFSRGWHGSSLKVSIWLDKDKQELRTRDLDEMEAYLMAITEAFQEGVEQDGPE